MARKPPSAADLADRTPRVLLNGFFDLMHAGHYNALRLTKQLFVGEITLVAAVLSTECGIKWKSAPVMSEAERFDTARACRWVDEVIMQHGPTGEPGFLEQHRIDFVVHGDGGLPLARPHAYHRHCLNFVTCAQIYPQTSVFITRVLSPRIASG